MGSTPENADSPTLRFFKGKQDILESKDGSTLSWSDAASRVREQLNDAMNAQHLGFLFGSGCSSYVSDGVECGIPTMAPLAKAFIGATGSTDATGIADATGSTDTTGSTNATVLTNATGTTNAAPHLNEAEGAILKNTLGIDLESKDFESNLERLLEVLHSLRFVLGHSTNANLVGSLPTVTSAIAKVTAYILYACSNGEFAKDNDSVVNIYQAFYRNLSYRGRNLPRPWVFTTNYDLFNETALDRLGMPYSNGFIGTVERRFNPASFRYSLAEQLDISSRRWSSVDGYLYLCKLHSSINWVEAARVSFLSASSKFRRQTAHHNE